MGIYLEECGKIKEADRCAIYIVHKGPVLARLLQCFMELHVSDFS